MQQTGDVETGALDALRDTDLCEDCEDVLSDFFCNVCQCSFCADCWDSQPAHKRKRLAPGQIPHEKTELLLANRVQNVFSYEGDERAFERLHKEDEATAWFGLEREMKDNEPFMFRDHGRFAELSTTTHRSLFERQRPSGHGMSDEANSTCVPSLVSFVGQTGAGKSTLIKLLIQFNQFSRRDRDFPSPVPGITGRDIPTSEDVHLYADPLTVGTENPIYYADSEGLDGGEREPMAATLRKTREKAESESSGSFSDYNPGRNYTEREILWMNSKLKRTRQFAASQLYPRILFAFSDVVVFVHRNPRAIEGVLERLLQWGSVAIETTYNQPILPYAIIALNATENDVDAHLWDVQISTNSLFESLADIVDKNVEFSSYADLWRSRGKKINTVEQLLKCYYSAVRVVRLPTNGRPKLIESQAQKLYLDIERGCRLARNVKAQTRMLLNALEFQGYLNHAFDHFCSTIDAPFDFVQCSYLNTHLSTTFGQSILTLAVSMARKRPRPKASSIFERLARLIASCILLDTMRFDLKGTSERIFAQYIPQLDAALKEFADRFWPCEFYTKGVVPPHMQAHLNNLAFQQSMRAAAVIMRCANVRSGHAAKGHQLSDGRVFARGSYESSFSFEHNRREILDTIYSWYHTFMERLSRHNESGDSRLVTASIIHRNHVLAEHYAPTENNENSALRHTTFCISCLFETPYVMLSCGHMLCRRCISVFGIKRGEHLVEMRQCPLEIQEESFQAQTIYLGPESAGIRVLALTNGGIRSIIQLEILKLIEEKLNGTIPIHVLFDMVIGEGTGGVISLGLVSRGWNIQDCEKHLLSLFEDMFRPTNLQKFPSLMKSSHAKYRSRPLDESLLNLFTPEQCITDLSSAEHPVAQSTKFVVLTSSATGRKVLFSNYHRKIPSSLPYALYPTTDYAAQPKIWQIARASMAHHDLFKPIVDPHVGNLFYEKDMSENFLIEVAHNECQATSASFDQEFPDMLVLIGCGKPKRAAAPSIASNDTKRTETSRRTKASIFSRTLSDDTGSAYSEGYSEGSGEMFATYQRPNFISLNPILETVPPLDDVASIPHLQQVIRENTDPQIITKIVAQLFATLFFAETDGTVEDTAAGEVLISVCVRCRLLNSSPEIREVGQLMKNGLFRNSEFVFWEEGFGAQQFPFSTEALDSMVRDARFDVLNVLIPLWNVKAIVHGVLRLENGEEYPLSGFPRSLLGRTNSRARRNLESTTTNPGSSLPSWTAPAKVDVPDFGDWDPEIPFRSLTVDDSHEWLSKEYRIPGMSDSPGPTVRESIEGGHRPPTYDEESSDGSEESNVTALPVYTR